MKGIVLVTATVLGLSSAGGWAGFGDELVSRQRQQVQRIHAGVRSGQLTSWESRQLLKGQNEIRRMERAARADGVITPAERARLLRKLDRQDLDIHREQHDRQHEHVYCRSSAARRDCRYPGHVHLARLSGEAAPSPQVLR